MNPADVLKYGHRTLHKAMKGIPDDEWETDGVCGVWSCKDIVSHLASYELALEDLLRSFISGGETPALDEWRSTNGEEYNATQVGKRRDLDWKTVLAELDETHARVLAMVPQIPAETWRQPGTIAWYGPEYSLDDFAVYPFYGHKREHSAQFNMFKDLLKAQGKITD